MEATKKQSIFMQMHSGKRTGEGSFNVGLKELFYLADQGNRKKFVKAFPDFFGKEVPEFGVIFEAISANNSAIEKANTAEEITARTAHLLEYLAEQLRNELPDDLQPARLRSISGSLALLSNKVNESLTKNEKINAAVNQKTTPSAALKNAMADIEKPAHEQRNRSIHLSKPRT